MRDSPACDDRPPPIPPRSPRRRKPRRSAPAPARRGRRRAGRRSAGSRPSLPPRCEAGGEGEEEKRPAPFLGAWRGRGAAEATELPQRACPWGGERGGGAGWACKSRAWRTDGGRPCSERCACGGAALRGGVWGWRGPAAALPGKAQRPLPRGRPRCRRARCGGCGGRKTFAARDVKHRINAQPVLGAKTRKEGRGEGRRTRKGREKKKKKSERPLKTEKKKPQKRERHIPLTLQSPRGPI